MSLHVRHGVQETTAPPDLDDVAVANLDKVKDRRRPSPYVEPFDRVFPDCEQLPCRARIEFQLRELDR
ncbi:hypothetical protein ACIOD2_19340 [Amycolatopsis sp. NPDC088138]|uniref:hypothetical protein n=1 Tax=Amycolatopsis sp. NPDC088138 TaxID=3363938 RepID=UPI0038176374